MKLSSLCIILLSVSYFYPSLDNPEKELIGTWKGEADNGQTILIEFTKDGDYNLILGGQVLTCSDEEEGQIKFALEQTKKSQALWIVLYDEETKREYSHLSATFTEKYQQLKLTLYFENQALDQIELTKQKKQPSLF